METGVSLSCMACCRGFLVIIGIRCRGWLFGTALGPGEGYTCICECTPFCIRLGHRNGNAHHWPYIIRLPMTISAHHNYLSPSLLDQVSSLGAFLDVFIDNLTRGVLWGLATGVGSLNLCFQSFGPTGSSKMHGRTRRRTRKQGRVRGSEIWRRGFLQRVISMHGSFTDCKTDYPKSSCGCCLDAQAMLWGCCQW